MAKTKNNLGTVTNTSGYSTDIGSYTTISNGASDTVVMNMDEWNYANELAVLHSDMDEITKIKVIQALKKPETQYIYYDHTKPKVDYPFSPQITWTCENNSGTKPIATCETTSVPSNTISYTAKQN